MYELMPAPVPCVNDHAPTLDQKRNFLVTRGAARSAYADCRVGAGESKNPQVPADQ
jgi:hypothetical protein